MSDPKKSTISWLASTLDTLSGADDDVQHPSFRKPNRPLTAAELNQNILWEIDIGIANCGVENGAVQRVGEKVLDEVFKGQDSVERPPDILYN